MAGTLRRLALAAALAGCAAAGAPGLEADASCPAGAGACEDSMDNAADEEASLIQLSRLKEVPEPRTKHLDRGRMAGYPKYVLNQSYTNPLNCKSKHDKELALVEQITNGVLMSELTGLVGVPKAVLPSRSSIVPADSQAAVDYLMQEFQSTGLAVCIQTFPVEYGSYRGTNANVIAFMPGTDPSTGSVTIGAHYDSRPYGATSTAPGADDNGSGTAVVLATVKAYAQVHAEAPPKRSVYFVGFGAEEVGLFGSHYFVEALASGATSLPAPCRPAGGFPVSADHRAITLDMVGWRSPNHGYETPTLTLETMPWSTDVTEEVAQVSKKFNKDRLALRYNSAPFGSDHISFLNKNYHAMLAIHGDDGNYPAYHTSQDVLGNVDPHILGMIGRACAGALMRIADVNISCVE